MLRHCWNTNGLSVENWPEAHLSIYIAIYPFKIIAIMVPNINWRCLNDYYQNEKRFPKEVFLLILKEYSIRNTRFNQFNKIQLRRVYESILRRDLL